MNSLFIRDRMIGAGSVLAGIVVCILTMGIQRNSIGGDIGSRAFPLMAAVVLILCGLLLFLKKPQEEQKPFLLPNQWARLLVLLCSYILFTAALWGIGFIISTPVFLFWLTYLLGKVADKKTDLVKNFLFCILLTVFMYFLYQKLLHIPLPKGVLFN